MNWRPNEAINGSICPTLRRRYTVYMYVSYQSNLSKMQFQNVCVYFFCIGKKIDELQISHVLFYKANGRVILAIC